MQMYMMYRWFLIKYLLLIHMYTILQPFVVVVYLFKSGPYNNIHINLMFPYVFI